MGVEEPVEPLTHFEPITMVVEQAHEIIDDVRSMECISVPSDSQKKTYEDYRCITDTSSNQYQLLQKGETQGNGLIFVDGFICASLGSRFGRIGDKYIFVLERDDGTRSSVKIIKADQKQDRHTLNSEGWVAVDGHIMEMVVNTDYLPESVALHGDYNHLESLEGKVVKIYKVGEI